MSDHVALADDRRPVADFTFEVGGVNITYSVAVDDVPTILGWSTSEVILYLGADGPLFQEGLRKVFGS